MAFAALSTPFRTELKLLFLWLRGSERQKATAAETQGTARRNGIELRVNVDCTDKIKSDAQRVRVQARCGASAVLELTRGAHTSSTWPESNATASGSSLSLTELKVPTTSAGTLTNSRSSFVTSLTHSCKVECWTLPLSQLGDAAPPRHSFFFSSKN